jgi:hypothetical protein
LSQAASGKPSQWAKGEKVEVVLKGDDFGKIGTVEDPDWYGRVLVKVLGIEGAADTVTKGFSPTDLLTFNRNQELAMRRKHR